MPDTTTFPLVSEPPLPADALADVRQLLQRPRVQLVLIALRTNTRTGFLVALSGGRYLVVPHPQSINILVDELHLPPLSVMVSVSAAVAHAMGKLAEGAPSYVILAMGKPGVADEPSEN